MQRTALTAFGSADAQRTLWIGQLHHRCDEQMLLEAFAHEQLVSALVVRDPGTSASLNYGFLSFATSTAAQSFLLKYNGYKFEDASLPIKLRWSSQETSSPGEPSEVTDSHSLFVGDLPPEVSDIQLQQHFQTYFPTAISAKVITDRLSGQSKGYGFVRFTSSEERDRALSVMNGQKIGQQTMRVNRAKAKKYQGDGLYYPSDHDASNTTAFVGNVNADISEEDLYNVFKRCGDIVSVKLLKAKGCAFITYATRDAAERAINYLHGKVIKNSAVRLCWGRRSIYNSFPLPFPGLPAAPHQPIAQLSSLQSFDNLSNSAFATQAYLPQQHFSAASMLPGHGPSYPGQNFWRPEIPQNFQRQRYAGQAGLVQGLLNQPYPSQSMQGFIPQAAQRSVQQNSYLPRPVGIPALSSEALSSASLDGKFQSASTPFVTAIPSSNGPYTLAETEDVLAQLSLGSAQPPPSFS